MMPQDYKYLLDAEVPIAMEVVRHLSAANKAFKGLRRSEVEVMRFRSYTYAAQDIVLLLLGENYYLRKDLEERETDAESQK